jgi:COP9 signalosome complex subunit 1
LIKFSGEADARDKGKNQAQTMSIKLLDGLAYLFIENFREASIRLSNVTLNEDP